MIILETLEELLAKKNSRAWIKHTVKLPVKDNIFVEKVDYIEENRPITCLKGSFYDVNTGVNLGKSITRRIYFIVDNVKLDQPKLVPMAEWREK